MPPSPHSPERLSAVRGEAIGVRTRFLGGIAVVGVVLAALGLWHLLHQVLLILTAIILAEGLRPGAVLLQRRGLPFGMCIAAVYAALLLAAVLLVILLAGPVVNGLAQVPTFTSEIARTLDSSLRAVQVSGDQLAKLATTLLAAVGGVAGGLLTVGGGLAGLVGDLASVFLLSVTWMAVSGDLQRFVLGLYSPTRRDLVRSLMAETGRAFAGYVRGVAINMIVIGGLAMLACWALRLPAPVLLGVFAGLCELIPLLGPFLGAVPAVLLGFTVGPVYPLLVAVVFLALQQLESNVLTPVVMKRQTGLRPFAILVALIVGGALAGIWGALVAVPMAAAVQIVVVRVVGPAIRRRHETEAVINEEVSQAVAAPT